MKKWKKYAVIGAAVFVIGATSASAAAVSAGYSTPAELVAGLTGQTVEDVIAERQETGKRYGTIAEDAGVLDEFEQQMLEQKKATLEARVAAGAMTQEQADAILAAMEDCDGTHPDGIGRDLGARFGEQGGTRDGSRLGGMAGNESNRIGGGRHGSGGGLGNCIVSE